MKHLQVCLGTTLDLLMHFLRKQIIVLQEAKTRFLRKQILQEAKCNEEILAKYLAKDTYLVKKYKLCAVFNKEYFRPKIPGIFLEL